MRPSGQCGRGAKSRGPSSLAWNTLGSSASPRSPRGMRERMKSRRKASSTDRVEKTKGRLRESRLVASSGRRERVHPTYPSPFLTSLLGERERVCVDEDAFDSGNLSSSLEIFGMSPPPTPRSFVRALFVPNASVTVTACLLFLPRLRRGKRDR